jgi:hypothetical protein
MFKELFKNKKQHSTKIVFSTQEELLDIIPHPTASHRHMPEWFRKLKPTTPSSVTPLKDPGTAKRCVPVLDAVSQGFIIPLWSDIHVKVAKSVNLFDDKDNMISKILDTGVLDSELIGQTVSDVEGNPVVARIERDESLSVRVEMSLEKIRNNNSIDGHDWSQVGDLCDLKKFKLGKTLLKFSNPWSIKTPKGWSVQFKNPANNWSNNIHILEGIVDTDEYFTPVNFPFVWTGTEEGEWVIPKGTPLVQVIPFKRVAVDVKVAVYNPRKEGELTNKLLTKFTDRYKTYCWHKRKKTSDKR